MFKQNGLLILEWKESESLFGLDKLIKDGLATVEYLDKEIAKIKPSKQSVYLTVEKYFPGFSFLVFILNPEQFN